MFDESKVTRLSVPRWDSVYRAEICPGTISFIAVHDISRGRALGGCRMTTYNNEAEALTDVLRLSRGMTFKNAIADLPLGGGKSIIMTDPKIEGEERERTLEEFGKFVAWVNRDQDRYYTAEDMNTTVADMKVVSRYTRNIFGTTVDPSPYTAWGVFAAIAFTADFFAIDLFHGKRSLEGKRVLIQGLGKVGSKLLEYLQEAGAHCLISDISEHSIQKAVDRYPSVEVVPPKDLFKVDADIFAPCARGEVITRASLNQLKFKILCGAANNQLQNTKSGKSLHQMGVIYCPDYIANMGGVCSIQYLEIENLSKQVAKDKIQETVARMLSLVFRAAFSNNLAFSESVDHVVKKIIWGHDKKNLNFHNKELFPFTYTSQPSA